MNRKKIFAICGSTRENSTNESILKGIGAHYKELLELTIYAGIADLPHFNPDVDDDHASPEVIEFRQQIKDSDGVIVCTPEYVFSLPGSLKNALEWTVSTTVFMDKPTALIIASGVGDKAFESLQLIMNTFSARMGNPGAILIKGPRNKFDEQGLPTEPQTKEKIEALMTSFINLFEVN